LICLELKKLIASSLENAESKQYDSLRFRPYFIGDSAIEIGID
jgi:hypothetical protein